MTIEKANGQTGQQKTIWCEQYWTMPYADHWITLLSLGEKEKSITLASCGDGSLPETRIWQISARRLRHVTAHHLWPHLVGVRAFAARDSLNSLTFKREGKCRGNAQEMNISIYFHRFPVPSCTRQIKAQRDPKGMHVPSYTFIYHNCL